jgi:hypothetical protein
VGLCTWMTDPTISPREGCLGTYARLDELSESDPYDVSGRVVINESDGREESVWVVHSGDIEG